MDGSVIDHSDSDSGDSWTLIEKNITYGDDAPDIADHPAESNTAESHDKDEDTDGISIITDSEPESFSACQISFEHYLSEENSTIEHHIPQFIPVNSHTHDNGNDDDSEREEDDLLGEDSRKQKTYVHRRNKRLSTVLNIIMLGSVITAAGVAIGHMWGAKTDCSMHTTTNVNKILSNLYKLQEENAYLRTKLKELTAFNNYQMNQQKTILKQNKCKKMFEEPLINIDSKKVTKCVDDKIVNDNKLLNSHMAEAVYEKQFLIEAGTSKNVIQENKKLDDEISQSLIKEEVLLKMSKHNHSKNENEIYLKDILNVKEHSHNEKENTDQFFDARKGKENLEKVKVIKKLENKVFTTKNKYLNENNILLRVGSNIDSSFNDGGKLTNFFNNEEEIPSIIAIKDDRFKDNSKFKREYDFEADLLHKDVPTKWDIKKTKDEYGTDQELLNTIKDKNHKKNNRKPGKNIFNMKRSPKGEYGTDDEIKSIKEEILKKGNQKDNSRAFKSDNKDNRNKTPKDNFGTEEEYFRNMKAKNLDRYNKKENNKGLKTEDKDFDKGKKSKDEYDSEIKMENISFNKDKKVKGDNGHRIDISEDLKIDNTYMGLKQKQERKKSDRQQSQKKNKRRNKYEQWEMKGGLFKDYDDISWTSSSSQGNEYSFNEPNVMDAKNYVGQGKDNNIDKIIDKTYDDAIKEYGGYFVGDTKGTDKSKAREDGINWLDKRARFRTEARQRLEQEAYGKGGVNAAGWYFQRVRKREQSRGKDDNSTFRKSAKRDINFKLKH